MFEDVAIGHFLNALGSPRLAARIREKEPTSLDAAEKIALKLEVLDQSLLATPAERQEKERRAPVNLVRSAYEVETGGTFPEQYGDQMVAAARQQADTVKKIEEALRLQGELLKSHLKPEGSTTPNYQSNDNNQWKNSRPYRPQYGGGNAQSGMRNGRPVCYKCGVEGHIRPR